MAVYTALNSGSTMTWTNVAVNTQMVSNNGYNVTANCTLTLPAAPSKGDVIKIFLESGAGFTVAQNAGQSVIAAGGTSTVGVGGSIVANTIGTAIELVCLEDITTWGLFSDQISLTIT